MKTTRISLVLALLSVAPLGCGADESLNPTSARPAPVADVQIVVDDLGISHVYAQSDADAFFGSGYAMARDRLFEMELNRRQAFGTSAEIFGSTAVNGDIAARTMNFMKLGEADDALARSERPEEAALVDAWANGVNARIAEIAAGEVDPPYGLGPMELDFVPEPWTAAHAYAVGKTLSFGLSNSLDTEILGTAITRFVPDTLARLPVMMPAYDVFTTLGDVTKTKAPPKKASHAAPPPSGDRRPPPAAWLRQNPFRETGSNNWAVAGEHTATGTPLLAGDPHQPLTSPTRLWPFHMSSADSGGTLDVIGFAFVGTPSVELGHNAHIGWTATTNFADVMDIWDVDPGDYTSFELGGVKHALTKRTETINVRQDSAAFGQNGMTSVDIYESAGFGVILPDAILPVPTALLADGKLLLNWTGFQPSSESSAYIEIDRATDIDSFETGVERLDVGAVNFVAASPTSIDYHVHAKVPDRGDPKSHPMPWRVISSKDPKSVWTSYLPDSKLPHWRDPQSGYLVTANNDPFGFTADGDVENDPYYYGALYDKGFRAHRITQELERLIAMKPGAITRADMEALQQDVGSSMADTLIPHLLEARAAVDTDPKLAMYRGRKDLLDLVQRIDGWDRRFDKTEGVPLVFLGLEWFAAKRTFETPLTSLLFNAISEQSPPFFIGMLRDVTEQRFPEADSFLPADGLSGLLLASLDDTSAWLTTRFGSIDAGFVMADAHSAEFVTTYGHDLTVPPVPVNGSADTVNVSAAPFFSNGTPLDQFVATDGSLYRMVIGFGSDGTPEATLDFARGTREDPTDPHFGDQQALWVEAGHKPLPFRKSDVLAHATETNVLPGRN